MSTTLRPRTLVLFVGDLSFFILALWLSLLLRNLEAPSSLLFFLHLAPFSLLFVAWTLSFFIAGLYEHRALMLARRPLSTTLLTAQTCNLAIAALFFFFIPIFGIAPKTLLLIYLGVSFVLVLLWRAWIFPLLGSDAPEPISVVGEGPELAEIRRALSAAHRPPIMLVQEGEGTPVPLAQLYEEMFGRVPLTAVDDLWVADALSGGARPLYDYLKRAMDIAIALPLAVLSLLLYPFVTLAIKRDDGGGVFVSLPRIGEDGRIMQIKKFRSMTGNDAGDYGARGVSKLSVTRVGRVLRDLRIDEFPQLWGVVRGDLSLIGPRPETPALVAAYERDIPHYQLRHRVKPGLSGWAQLYHDNHPHHGTDIDATREKLSYDLYYLKHRSLALDLTVALKTIKKLLTRSGV